MNPLGPQPSSAPPAGIRTPDQRLRVFVSSTIKELADERRATSEAITALRLHPVLFELGARPHPPRDLYRAYLEQSDIFIGIYWESYGWVAPDMDISGIEDEMRLAGGRPKLIYVKEPAPNREPGLARMLEQLGAGDAVVYRPFRNATELGELVSNDLALLLTEAFESTPAEVAAQRRAAAQLPALVNEFLGRDREMLELERVLLDDRRQIVTLTGAAGIGKSRLALEAGQRVRGHFKDGAFLVLLEAIREPDLVLPTIMHTIGIQESGGLSPRDALMQYLQNRSMLLVLDNFEHVLPASVDVINLLKSAPGVKVLITSRVRLNLQSEREVLVEPLDVPPPDERDTRAIDASASVRLFGARAAAVSPGFAVTSGNAAAVAEICRKLDGIPLAIELAAARARILPPEAMIKRLESSLGLLRGGGRDLPERHQTLRSAIEWSLGLLSDEDRLLFTRCGVFRGGWTLDAAEQICAADAAVDPLEGMQSLIENNLVRRLPGDDVEPRFSMFDTVRERAGELLDESADETSLKERHALYYLDLLTASEEAIRSPRQTQWLDALEADVGNLRATLRWCLDHHRLSDVADAGWSLWLFWWVREHLAEGRRWMEELLRYEQELDDPAAAKAHATAGIMSFWQADYGAALPHITRGLELMETIGHQQGIALCNLALGFMECPLGEVESGIRRFARSRECFERAGDTWGLAIAYSGMGWVATGLDLEEVTDEQFEEGVAVARRVGTPQEIGFALGNRGRRYVHRGDLDGGEKNLVESLDLLSRVGARGPSAYQIESLALVALERGDHARGATLLGGADAARGRVGAPLGPIYGPKRERTIARLREAMGGAAFDEAWARGAAMSFDEAVEYAIGQPDAG